MFNSCSLECPIGSFRSVEISKCVPCPPNSNASKTASGICNCLPGFYRHPSDGKLTPCYKPPGPPTNLTLLFVDHISAILSWNSPNRDHTESVLHHTRTKYITNLVYKVVCSSCSQNVVFTPSSDTFNDTKLTLTNLEPITTYILQIHSMNGVSRIIGNNSTSDNEESQRLETESSPLDGLGSETAVSGNKEGFENMRVSANPAHNKPIDLSQIKTEYAEITFTTTESAILSTVSNVHIVATTNNEVDLAWDKPAQSDSSIEFYEVRWFPKPEFDAINKTALNTKETKAHIENLTEDTEYGFQVRYKTLNGYGTYSNIVYAHTQQSIRSGKSNHIVNDLLSPG